VHNSDLTEEDDIMDAVERIEKDIVLFTKNIKEIESIKIDEDERKVVEMASNYRKDTDYYLEKKDYLTSFGCITYAHGLLDAIRLLNKLI
jgi:uncharacterized protein